VTTSPSDLHPVGRTRRERRAAERLERRSARRPTPSRSPWQSPAVLATIGALVVGLALVAVAVLTGGGPSGSDDLVPPANPLPSGIPADGATLGPADAPVTVEVWADFQCPACGHYARETEPQLIRTFVAAGSVKLVHRDFAFLGGGRAYDESVEAAAAARCAARQGRFWDYEAWLFANQHGENAGAFTRQRLTAIAERVGLDVAAWTSCMDAGTEQAAAKAETQAGAAQGIGSTPTIVVNGTPYVGALPYEQLATIIRGLLPASPSPSSP
jgi:protein-disulfide isomerase